MVKLLRFFTSHIGRKVLMGITGLALILFLMGHLSGNMLLFVGSDLFNNYGHLLISNPLIYIAEVGLIFLILSHAISGAHMWYQGKKARPDNYAVEGWARGKSRKSVASKTMIISGLVIFIFVPLHLWGFKYGPVYTSALDPEIRDLFRLTVEVFQNPWYVFAYVVTMVIIGFHLWHGFGSAFESLGVNYRRWLRCLGQLLALIIAIGFSAIPLIIYFSGGTL